MKMGHGAASYLVLADPPVFWEYELLPPQPLGKIHLMAWVHWAYNQNVGGGWVHSFYSISWPRAKSEYRLFTRNPGAAFCKPGGKSEKPDPNNFDKVFSLFDGGPTEKTCRAYAPGDNFARLSDQSF